MQEGVVGAKPKPQFKCASVEAPAWNRGSHKQASVRVVHDDIAIIAQESVRAMVAGSMRQKNVQ